MIFEVVVLVERAGKWPLRRRETVRVEVDAWGRWGPLEVVAAYRAVAQVWDAHTVEVRVLGLRPGVWEKVA